MNLLIEITVVVPVIIWCCYNWSMANTSLILSGECVMQANWIGKQSNNHNFLPIGLDQNWSARAVHCPLFCINGQHLATSWIWSDCKINVVDTEMWLIAYACVSQLLIMMPHMRTWILIELNDQNRPFGEENYHLSRSLTKQSEYGILPPPFCPPSYWTMLLNSKVNAQ